MIGRMTPRSLLKTLLIAFAISLSARLSAADLRVLVYQKNGKGYVHDNLAASAQALREIAAEQKLEIDISTNETVFTEANLKRYHALIFANSNNEAFANDEQRASFQSFIEAGGGFMGIHSSSASERNWTWFQRMQGGKFLRHSPMQTLTVQTLDRTHPTTAHLPTSWTWTDECYFFTNLNQKIQVLLTVDLAALRDPQLARSQGAQAGGVYPLAWSYEENGSRRFYTSLGHKIEHYSDPVFRNHLRGGIRWVLRLE